MTRPLAFLFGLWLSGCGRSALEDELFVRSDASASDANIDARTDAQGDSGKDTGGDANGPPCTLSTECNDNNACTSDLCVNQRCEHRPLDQDGDGVVSSDCGGSDCNDRDPRVRPGVREACGNRVDDNCDGLVDCQDRSCDGAPGCTCGPFEICGNGSDDDCNNLVDCTDPSCRNAPGCSCDPQELSCTDGRDNDCNGKVDCDDSACQNHPACQCGRPEDCVNGRDDDCNNLTDCADPACSATPTCTCSQTPEDCANGRDDNCNLLVDCADPACDGIGPCRCAGPPVPEACANGTDDDCDELVDCADPDCRLSPACTACTQEACNNGMDDDCNGRIDCADAACAFAPNCQPKPEICNNNLDDDLNGLTDCEDPACKSNPQCVLEHGNCLTALPLSASGSFTGNTTGFVGKNAGSCGGAAGEAVFKLTLTAPTRVHLDTVGSGFDSALYVRAGACGGGRELACDDDSGGSRNASLDFSLLYPGVYFIFVDGFTVDAQRGPDEGPYVLNVSLTENPGEDCGNKVDDDGDHFADCADPDCSAAPGCNCLGGTPAGPEFGVAACTDGIDNDCDGVVDCADKDCRASDFYVTECCNGQDDNGNGTPDDFSCRCASDADCMGGQRCYTHTAFACGPPCSAFVGDICPFVAAGSSCSQNTNECEFP